MTSIVMVMPYHQLVRKAREEGFTICSIWDPRLQSADYLSDVRDASDAFITVDFSRPEELKRVVREAASHHGARWVYHVGREDSMLPVYEVADELGRSVNPSSSIRLLNDKLAMRDLLKDRRLSPVRYTSVPDSGCLRAALQSHGLPAIVKPTSLFGSRGVHLLRDELDILAWERRIQHLGYHGPLLIEEQLKGPEHSVETISCDGTHYVIGITAKQVTAPPLFVETGHIHPAPLTAEQREAMEELVLALLDACGYRSGPAHTELIWTANGPRIVESQARLGGDRIPRLIELATGLDIEREIFRALAGRPPSPCRPTRTAGIRYLQLEPGRVHTVAGIERARALEFVDELVMPFDLGDWVPETTDSKSRHGHVIVSGSCASETDARAIAALRSVRVNTELSLGSWGGCADAVQPPRALAGV
jgi:biotin carboxylase